jgi:hypothetical protein
MIFDSFILSRAISVAAQLGLADMLRAGPKSADELAQTAGAHAPSLYRVMRALASEGIFAEDDAGCFHLTPLAEPLCSDTPGSWCAYAKFIGSDWSYRAYGDLLYSVQTGRPAFVHAFGKPLFDYLQENPEQASIFNTAMTNVSQSSAPAILSAYDFSGFTKLVDLGGGHGFLLASILRAYPHLHGVLFDLPSVVEGAVHIREARDVSGRCEIIDVVVRSTVGLITRRQRFQLRKRAWPSNTNRSYPGDVPLMNTGACSI